MEKCFDGHAKCSFKITDTQVNNIMFSFLVLGVLSGKVNWVETTEVYGEPKMKQMWQELPGRGVLLIHDKCTGDTHSFSLLNLLKGVGKLIEKGHGYLKDGYISLGYCPDIANRIVQYGIFGEVRYE